MNECVFKLLLKCSNKQIHKRMFVQTHKQTF